MSYVSLFIIFSIICVLPIQSQRPQRNSCSRIDDCGDCTRNRNCVWCNGQCIYGNGRRCETGKLAVYPRECRQEDPKPTCPPIKEGQVGICLEQCSRDRDCKTGEKCCSNGCGHICVTVVTPKGCDYNGQKYVVGDSFPSSDKCNTCSCTESGQVVCTMKACINTEKPGTCPPVRPGTVGACVIACSGDNDCEGDKKCCSNGCGAVCTALKPDGDVTNPCAATLCPVGSDCVVERNKAKCVPVRGECCLSRFGLNCTSDSYTNNDFCASGKTCCLVSDAIGENANTFSCCEKGHVCAPNPLIGRHFQPSVCVNPRSPCTNIDCNADGYKCVNQDGLPKCVETSKQVPPIDYQPDQHGDRRSGGRGGSINACDRVRCIAGTKCVVKRGRATCVPIPYDECTSGVAYCLIEPCRGKKCDVYGARCNDVYCGGCYAIWTNRNGEVINNECDANTD